MLRPSWANAAGQLLGFLIYGLILIFPFVGRFAEAGAGDVVSLIVYISLLIYSGALAIYYLFGHKETRLWELR